MAPPPPQDLGNNLDLEIGELELAAEAYSEMGGTPIEEEQHSDVELDERGRTKKTSTRCGFLSGFLPFNLVVRVSASSFVSGALSSQPPRHAGAPRRAGLSL